MKETTWKALAAVILGGLSAYMRMMTVPLVMLVGVIIVDYVSGMLKAWVLEELSSRVGLKGIVKKLSFLMLVCVAGVVDWLVYSGLREVGISVDLGFCFGLIVTVWLIINELISILENLDALGVPMPAFLKRFVRHLKSAVEIRGDSSTETEG